MPPHPITPDELHELLTSTDPARTGVLATVRDDGRPHVVPIWFVLDESDGSLVFNTGVGSVKGRNLASQGRAAICVETTEPPYTFAMIEGRVTLSEDPAELLTWATRIGTRYVGPERGEELGKRNGAPGSYVVRVHRDKVTGLADL
ncbi:MAG: PPOX class F420-dependent oxidoreductase [Acidimicrobiaceae bacterium]|nr:PPOX class F420-dependent oxidoreductase [Acidimicrobiaceae bacterium]